MNKTTFFSFLAIVTIAIGIFFRLYRFDIVPYGLNHDGAQDALQALEIMRHPLPLKVYFSGGSGETLFKYYLAFFMSVFGISVWSIKLAATMLGIMTIPVFYFFAKALFDRTSALCATFLLATGGWHIIVGKTVWRAISTPLIEVIALYFLVLAYKKHKPVYYILSGLGFALVMYTYNGARALPLLAFSAVAASVFQERTNMIPKIRNAALFVVAFVITLSPLLVFAAHNWDEFNSRFNSLSVFDKVTQSESLKPLVDNAITSALIFNVRANGDDFFVSQPLLDPPTSWLFLVGVGFCLWRFKKFEHRFVFIGLLINLIPGMISVPNGNRNIATLPFVYLIAGVGFVQLLALAKKWSKKSFMVSPAITVLIVLFAITTTYSMYIGPRRQELWGFYPDTTIVGTFMKENHDRYDFYLTDNYPRDALTFLTYNGGDPFAQHYTWYERKESFLTVVPQVKKIAFIMTDSQENRDFLPLLKSKYQKISVQKLWYRDDSIRRPAALLVIVDSKT